MPVIKADIGPKQPSAATRNALHRKLVAELRGKGPRNGPVIFEMPLQRSKRKDVFVVWDEFREVPVDEREALIRKAYPTTDHATLAQVYGLTVQEAMDDGLLPYSIVSMARKGEADPEQLEEAMRREGVVVRGTTGWEVRLPTMPIAESALRRLVQQLPTGYWGIQFQAANRSTGLG